MRRFKWTKAQAVYLPEFDAEHRNLYHLGEELQSAIESEAGLNRIVEVTRALLAALEDHFSDEERKMRATHYPSYAWHKQQHDTVRKRTEEFIPEIEAGDRQAALLLLDFIAGWLKDHTSLTDRMLCSYLRNHERALSA